MKFANDSLLPGARQEDISCCAIANIDGTSLGLSTLKQRDKEHLSILLLGSQMATGGAQRVLLDQANWFKTQGHNVTAAFLYDKEGLYEKWKNEVDAPLLDLQLLRTGDHFLNRVTGFLGGLLRLWRLLRRQRFDVIETFTYQSNLVALPLAWMAGLPVRIATHHGRVEDVPVWQERLHVLIARNFASKMIAVSNEVCEQLVSSGMDRRSIVVIPNGISLSKPNQQEKGVVRKRLGLPEGAIILISVGRLVYQKAHNILIDALEAPTVRELDVALYIAGEGSLRTRLEAQIQNLDLGNQVHLLGNKDNISTLLSVSDIFVLSSRWEGLPIALLEAMGTSLPVVATRVEGVEEVVQNGIQGLLVPPEDANALAEALLQLIKDPLLRTKMGIEARKRIHDYYTTEIMCRKYLEVMFSSLSKKDPETSINA